MSSRKKQSIIALPIVLILLIILNILNIKKILIISAAEILLLVAVLASIVSLFLGYSWDEIQDAISEKIISTLPGILIILCVGFVIGTWIIGGTIPMLISYGLHFIHPQALLVTSFILTSIVSTATGTSWGSVGTAGIALIGIANIAGIPLAPVAGAIICGAHFGDKISPLSDTTNLAAISSGTSIYTHIIHMLKTTIPAYIVSALLFWYFGSNFNINPQNLFNIKKTSVVLEILFQTNIFLWLPILCIFTGSILKASPVPIMISSGFIALLNGIFIQDFSLSQILSSGINGFNITFFSQESQQLLQEIPAMANFLNRGGMSSMMNALLIMLLAYSFTGALAVSGVFNIFLEYILKFIHNRASLIIVTMISSFGLGAISETYVSLIISGELFQNIYSQYNLSPQNLSRALEDSVTGTQPFIPWTAAGIYMSTTLGVPTLEYIPWAILSYISIIFSIGSAITGIGINYIDKNLKTNPDSK